MALQSVLRPCHPCANSCHSLALLRMTMQLTPEVQTPTIAIETRWPGASPQEVEQEIAVEQEEQLKGVEGLTKMSSESSDSIGRITLEFMGVWFIKLAVVDATRYAPKRMPTSFYPLSHGAERRATLVTALCLLRAYNSG